MLVTTACVPAVQYVKTALKLRKQGATDSVVAAKLKEGGLQNTFPVGFSDSFIILRASHLLT